MQKKSLDIAIVGVGAIMPIGLSREEYWKAILEGVDGITDVPDSRWQKALYYSEDRRKSDTTYSSIGALVKGFSFDRKRFRVPPKTVEVMDPTQQMAVTASVEALEDAGVDLEAVDGSRVAVIFGNALGGDIRHSTTLRIRLAEVLAKLESDKDLSELSGEVRGGIIRRLEGHIKSSLPPVNEDTMPGELSNCIAGRVCNLLDLRGQSYTVDAACASSLAAMSAACHALRAGECDLALTGGVDNSMGPETYVKFAKIGALSASGSRPFDAAADGFVLGEGCGILALRRFEDVATTDRVYAVIRSIGASSDGRGKSITAPNPNGQHLAIERAYEAAGFDLNTVDYIEAHGTSTTIGDAIECRVLSEVLERSGGRSEPVRLGSVKSQIGHLKSAAGVAGLIKAAMAIKHKVFPPSINFEHPNEALSTTSTLAVQTRVEPWKRLSGHPRRAAVSSFGFGGTNFHVVLEEAVRDEGPKRPKATPQRARTDTSGGGVSSQVVALGAPDAVGLVAATRELAKALDVDSTQGELSLAEFIESRGLHRDISDEKCRLALATSSIPELKDQLKRAVVAVKKDSGSALRLLANRGCFVRLGPHDRGTLGMLFPGQGSQYVGMLDELRQRYDVVARTLDEADAVMKPILGQPLTDFIFGKGFGGESDSGSKSKSAEAALLQTTITQPAVLACDVAILRLLAEHGIRPDVVAGHSLGEYAACVAAGVLELGEALKIVAARGHHMTAATPEGGDPGWMAAIGASVDHVEAVLKRVPGYVVPANKNCKTQTIIAGASESVEHAMALFAAEGIQTTRIPVSHAFHTRVVSSASGPLRMVLEETGLREPSVPILSNVTGDLYPTGGNAREAIIDLLSKQVASPVEFISQIERMHELGVRTFLEVGPKKALASFVASILEEQPHQAYITNHPKRGELRSFHEALAALIADGYPLRLDEKTKGVSDASDSPPTVSDESVADVLIGILCEKTGYDADEIELDFELEADLGVDTVKQAEVLAAVREHYGLDRDEAFRLADYPSVEALIEYVGTRAAVSAESGIDTQTGAETETETDQHQTTSPEQIGSQEPVSDVLVRILCEKTGYDADEIELDFELEADLGVDTVKQAEVLAAVREHYGLDRDEAFRLADYPSVEALIEYVENRAAVSAEPGIETQTGVETETETGTGTDQHIASSPEQIGSQEPVSDVLVRILCEKTGYDADEIELDFELEADLGVDTVKQAEVLAAVREHYGLDRDEAFRLAEYPSVEALIEYVEARAGLSAGTETETETGTVTGSETVTETETGAGTETDENIAPASVLESHRPTSPRVAFAEATAGSLGLRRDSRGERGRPAPESTVESREVANEVVALDRSVHDARSQIGPYAAPSGPDAIVVSGVSAGLPGLDDPFASDSFDQLLEGRSLISEVSTEMEKALATKGIVRVVKHGAGEPEFIEVRDPEQALHLAGRGSDPELSNRYGIPAELHEGFDTTTQWSLAAAVDVLRDAGLPLVRTEHVTRSGRKLKRGYRLPEAVGRRTGVIFASAFPGCNRLIDEVEKQVRGSAEDDGEPFSRSFLVQALAFAHAHVAQYIGALGPNAHMNAACASTTISLATATDWIRAGRCDRVIVVGADDVTSDTMFPYIGAGFLAMGAATTERDVTKAALPFDRRRNGMILGMGAVALVVERASEASARGVTPIAEVVATRLGNSAFNPVRLHPAHVAEEVRALVDEVERDHGLDRLELSKSCVFMSHEPYTPARGGSAQAEVAALRGAFGDGAREVLIANTKGYTGHAMGAGLEEFVAIRSLERQFVPPVPNLREPDPEMADLKISKGGHVPHEYSLRLAAGFGSQVAVTLLRRTCPGPDRIDEEALARWASLQSGSGPVRLAVEHRHLQAIPMTDQPGPTPVDHSGFDHEVDLGDLGQGIRAWQVVTDAVDPLEGGGDGMVPPGKPIVVLGGGALAAPVIKGLEALGAVVIHLDGVDLSLEPSALERALEVQLQEGGRPLGLINLLPLEEAKAGEAQEVHRRLKMLFHTVRAMGVPERFVVTLTGLGGGCGVEPMERAFAASAGAHAGFTKALAREWADQATVKVVDIDAEVLGDVEWASTAVREGLSDDGLIEVGYGRDGRRTTALRETVTVGAHRFVPTSESVVVLTGGAGGITAAAGLELVARGVGRVALLDLSPLLSDDPETIDVDLERRKIKEELKAGGERVTPAKIEALLAPFRAGRQVAETIDAFRRAGAEVFYRQCDLADGKQVEAAISSVRERFGRIDGVVHGAGLEVSQTLEDKSPDTFDRVFRGKALGAIHLWRALADELPSFFIAFSSVAGRFGNMGQQDYAAANEVLARLGASAPATVQALTVDWTAWDQIGMAANASMRALLRARGVDLLPPTVGTTALADLLLTGTRGEVVICGRLGELASPRFVASGVQTERQGWLDRITRSDDEKIVAEIDLDPGRHRYLEDHEIAGVKVLPGVVGLELMVATARQLLGGGVFVEARDVRFERPVKVHEGRPVTIRVEAQRTSDDRAEVTLRSHREAASGRALEAEHFRATIQLGVPSDVRPLDRLCFDTPENIGPEASVIYGPDAFFHGPGFQVLEMATRVAEDHIVARVHLPDVGELSLSDGTPTEHTAPLSWEAVLQAAGLWAMSHSRVMALPHGIERAQRFGPIPDSGEVVVRVAALSPTDGQSQGVRRFDVEVHDEDGHLLQRALGMTLIETGETAHLSGLGGVSSARTDGYVERRDLNLEGLHDAEEFERLAKCYLSEVERQRLDGFRSDKRRREWLGGRIAAKHLIREHLRDRYGIAIEVRQLEVMADSKGAPMPRLIDRPDVKHVLPNIAITHCHDHAIVGLVPASAKARVGLDLERIELRSPSFERNVLTDGEHQALNALGRGARDERVTLFWALKEATSKALGLGLTIDPREMEVIDTTSDGAASIHLYGRARERYEALGGRGLEARTKVEGHDAFAVVVLRLDGADTSRSVTVGDAAVLANHLQPQRLETWRNLC